MAAARTVSLVEEKVKISSLEEAEHDWKVVLIMLYIGMFNTNKAILHSIRQKQN